MTSPVQALIKRQLYCTVNLSAGLWRRTLPAFDFLVVKAWTSSGHHYWIFLFGDELPKPWVLEGKGSHEQIKELRHRYLDTKYIGHQRNMQLDDYGGVKGNPNNVGPEKWGTALRGAKQEWRS